MVFTRSQAAKLRSLGDSEGLKDEENNGNDDMVTDSSILAPRNSTCMHPSRTAAKKPPFSHRLGTDGTFKEQSRHNSGDDIIMSEIDLAAENNAAQNVASGMIIGSGNLPSNDQKLVMDNSTTRMMMDPEIKKTTIEARKDSSIKNTASVEKIQDYNEVRKPNISSFNAKDEKPLKPLPKEPVECTKLPDGPEPITIEIEYPSTKDLQPVEGELDTIVEDALKTASSKEWAEACGGLLLLRRIAVHHPDTLVPRLDTAVSIITSAVRSLRSALSKTAIMTANDLFIGMEKEIVPFLDVGGSQKPLQSLLGQLLLKAASNDKKFVIEEAVKALYTMAKNIPSEECFAAVLPYAEHKNPKVRGKAAQVIESCLSQMEPSAIECLGLDKLLRLIAQLITDNTPDARGAAKAIALAVKKSYESSCTETKIRIVNEDGEEVIVSAWKYFCDTNLGPSKSANVLRATD